MAFSEPNMHTQSVQLNLTNLKGYTRGIYAVELF